MMDPASTFLDKLRQTFSDAQLWFAYWLDQFENDIPYWD